MECGAPMGCSAAMIPVSRSRVFAFCLGILGMLGFGVALVATYVARDAVIAELRWRVAERMVDEVVRDDDASVRRSFTDRVSRVVGENPDLARIVFARALPSRVDVKLLREARIVCAANALVFAMLASLALSRRPTRHDLVLPSALLIVSAGITAYGYLFAQRWLRAILLDDYIGLAYLVYLALVFVVLARVVRTRGRVVLDAIGTVGGIGA